MSDFSPPVSACEFLRDRARFLNVTAAQNAQGSWDVLLTIDGHYARESDARKLVEHFRHVLSDVLANEDIKVVE